MELQVWQNPESSVVHTVTWCWKESRSQKHGLHNDSQWAFICLPVLLWVIGFLLNCPLTSDCDYAVKRLCHVSSVNVLLDTQCCNHLRLMGGRFHRKNTGDCPSQLLFSRPVPYLFFLTLLPHAAAIPDHSSLHPSTQLILQSSPCEGIQTPAVFPWNQYQLPKSPAALQLPRNCSDPTCADLVAVDSQSSRKRSLDRRVAVSVSRAAAVSEVWSETTRRSDI